MRCSYNIQLDWSWCWSDHEAPVRDAGATGRPEGRRGSDKEDSEPESEYTWKGGYQWGNTGAPGGRQGSAAWESERKIGDPSRDLVASRRASAVRVRATAWTVPETDATPSTDSPQTTQDLVSELSPESAPEPEPGPEPELPAEAAAEPEREAWAEIVPEPEPEPKEPESALDLEPEPADAENSQPVDEAWVKPIIEAKPDIRSKKGKKAKKAKKGESQDACCLC
ncbi:hypothetical protein CDEST_15625 [Colletotrichum destructivum]|uniref:Uncharacterized protein n=1 Tax=Colletotrichum destructivum TaxID=34406 RepID=A0AAX4J559_9PEZI|nr:hypothetical protein CDEST_15625 [Colletotrichum destructivum]